MAEDAKDKKPFPAPTNPEERQRNLAKAMEARKARSVLCQRLKDGEADPFEVLNETTPLVLRLPVRRFLLACPGIGPATAELILEEAQIPFNKRIRGLGRRQRASLVTQLEKYLRPKSQKD